MDEHGGNLPKKRLPLRTRLSQHSNDLSENRNGSEFFQIQKIPKGPTPLMALRKQVSDNEAEIARLKSKLDKEQAETRELRNNLLELNTDFRSHTQQLHDLESNSDSGAINAKLVEILIHHNEVLTNLHKYFSANLHTNVEIERLKKKVESLNKEIQQNKPFNDQSLKPHQEKSQKYKQAKLKFLQKEFESLKDFIEQDINAEKMQDDEEISQLEHTFNEISKESQNLHERVIQQEKTNVYNNITQILSKITEAESSISTKNYQIMKLKSNLSEIQAQIEIENETSSYLTRKSLLLNEMIPK